MANTQAQRLVEQAAAILRRGASPDAARYLQKALEVDPSNAAAHRLMGIVLAQSGRKDEALESLRRATTLDPSDACSLYNYALQLGRTGQIEEARTVAGRAVDADPSYAEATELVACLQRGECSGMFDPGVLHSIGWVAEAGKAWPAIGWTIVALAAVAYLANLYYHPFAILPGLKPILKLSQAPGSVALVFATIVCQLSVFAWMFTDLLDRRGRVIWFVPLMVFAIWGGLAAVPMALYLVIGRRA